MFECHITIEPYENPEEKVLLLYFANVHKFNLSHWMRNYAAEETPEEVFFTAHSLNREPLQSRMVKLVAHLRENGWEVRRYKIEQILLDSRVSDELSLF